MGLQFFPRGGSAHVARNLAAALPATGWDVRISTGSVSLPGTPGDARHFYRGFDVHPADMTAALEAPDPMLAAPMPLHPSFEDRPGAPDRVFAALDDAAFEHQAAAWERELALAGAPEADVLHLHHLTPLNQAAARVAPGVPVVGHVHGTELLMLEEIEAGAPWPHAPEWAERLRDWAQDCERLILLSESQLERAQRLLDVDADRCVHVPNGFDPALFDIAAVDPQAHWASTLPGADPAAFAPGNPVLLYVGRFTAVKRVGLLIEAYARARERFRTRAPLVLVGGFPGEHEGEHPDDTLARLGGVPDVFLAGWHDHAALPAFFAAADAVVLPSVREQFGQVLVEGMACALPAVAVDAHGPAEIVIDGETGWLVPPDDRGALEDALVRVVDEPAERLRRGALARTDVRDRFAWPSLAERVAATYDAAIAEGAFTN